MAVLVYSELQNLMLDRAQANVSTDAPVSATEIARFLNDAYSDVWALSGGRTKSAISGTAWTNAQASTTGNVTGLLTDVEEILHVWASTTSGSVGGLAGDVLLSRVDVPELYSLRASSGYGTYSTPKVYAVSRTATATPASVNLLALGYWPVVTGFYFPITYVPQFTPIDSATVTTPDVNDLESRDIALLAAAKIAPLIGRAELVPSILADVSERTQKALARRFSAMMEGKQDDSTRANA